ncbi:MAG: hypothetical protein GQ570_13310 [Helicobacteraceae bacterium]|nr:hypothetical protein [Helicobacteraceae bacterium]
MKREELSELLSRSNINKKEFATIAGIPYSTVSNWGVMRSGKILDAPEWVRAFLHYYEKAKKLDYLTDEICAKIAEVKS